MLDGDASSRVDPGALKDPLSPRVHDWIRAFVKALRGLRVYSDNNEMLQRYLDEVHGRMRDLFEDAEEVSLGIRDDRLIHRGDVVWFDADRMDGLPFILFRNAFRRLTFERGMTTSELLSLMRAIVADYSRFDIVGEDLVTALWRLQLPHLRYVTIDTLTVAAGRAASEEDKREIDQLQSDVEAIVALVYQTDASGDDIVSGLSISKEDLEALQDVRSESTEDLDLLDHATERAITDVDPDELAAFVRDLEADTSEALVARTMDVLVRLLFTERSSRDAQSSVGLLQQLMDTLLMGYRFSHATELVRRLREAAQDLQDLQKLHIARQLLKLFSTENRILPLVVGLNDRNAARSVSELSSFLQALGEPVVPALVESLAQIEAPVHRRVIRNQIIELGLPDVARLETAMDDFPGYAVIELLLIAAHHPPQTVVQVVRKGLEHANPRVRAQATKMLRAYTVGPADELLCRRIVDSEQEVRITALRVAVARKSRAAASRIRTLLSGQDDGLDLDLKDLRFMTQALVAIEGEAAVPVLARWLNPGFIAALKGTDLQVVAAHGLAQLPVEASRVALSKGTRSLVPKVRDACRRALERIDRDQAAPAPADVDATGDLTIDFYGGDSGDYVPVAMPHAFETPRPPARGIPPTVTPIESMDLPSAPPPEARTDVISQDDLAAAREIIRQARAAEDPTDDPAPVRSDLTSDLTVDMDSEYPPGSVREVIPEIDVIVPRADEREATPTPTSSGQGPGSQT